MIDLFSKIAKYIDYFVETRINQCRVHIRVITDKRIEFPHVYRWVDYDKNIELSEIKWEHHPGWGKPDLIVGDVEVRYLWKQFNLKKFNS